MNHTQAIQKVASLLPEIKETGDAGGVLLKYAHKNNLHPEQLVKLAQVFNTVRTVHQIDTGVNKAASIPILDTADLVQRYTELNGTGAKSASFVLGESKQTPNFWEAASGITKSAKTECAMCGTAMSGEDCPNCSKMVKSCFSHVHDAIERRDEVEAWNRNMSTLRQLRDDQWDIADKEISKIAQFISDNDFDLAEIEEDVMTMGSDMEKAAFAKALDKIVTPFKKLARFNPERPTRRNLLHDRHNILPVVKAAGEAFETIHNCDAYYHKEASVMFGDILGQAAQQTQTPREAPSRRPNTESGEYRGRSTRGQPQTGSGESKRKPPEAKYEINYFEQPKSEQDKDKSDTAKTVADAINGVLGHTTEKLDGVHNFLTGNAPEGKPSINNLLGGYDPNKRQRKIDGAVQDVEMVATLQRLMLTDPILSEADPEQLVQMYNDLRMSNPDIGRNLNGLRFALREALQYGGVPMQTTKTLSEINKLQAEAAKARADVTDRTYR